MSTLPGADGPTAMSWVSRVRTSAAMCCLAALSFGLLVPIPAGAPVNADAGDDGGGDEGGGDDDHVTAALVASSPCRLLDTRSENARLSAGVAREVDVVGRCGVGADVVAVAATVTAVHPAADGYITAWGSGPRPGTSTVNMTTERATANAAIVPVGDDGRIRLWSDARTDALVDVTGAFVERSEAADGRFVPIEPRRALDTRVGGTSGTGRPLEPGETVRVPSPSAVPGDAVALAVTVTVVDARRDGHVTGYAAGSDPPETSIANVVAGETRATSAILPAGSHGLDLVSSAGGHLLVDVTGWFTGPGAATSADGLFVPDDPTRLHDSRAGRLTLAAGGTREVAGASGVAWAVNLTATNVRADGYVTVHPARTQRPGTSTVNTSARGSVSNAAIAGVTERGLAAFTSSPTDVVVDVTGWFTGTPLPHTEERAPDRRAPQRALLITDSSFGALDWVPGAGSALRGADFTLDVGSCRRLEVESCRGRYGVVPPTALEELAARRFGEHDVVVVLTGYNDVADGLAGTIQEIVETARARGIATIMWFTYREEVGYEVPVGPHGSYAEMNAVLRSSAGADLTLVDWSSYTRDADDWFGDDGVHATLVGAHGMADTVSRALAAVDGRPCPMPTSPGETPDAPCPMPGAVDGDEGLPDVVDLYGVPADDPE